jgi:transposase
MAPPRTDLAIALSRTSTSASAISTTRSPNCYSSTAASCRELHGVGSNLAATIIAQAGDARRFRDAAAFARFCGAAPIPCDSGQTSGRYRLHRGGNRQLNAALYRIERHHPAAKAYLARKLGEGKTAREARRALKRHLANVLYRRLITWANACREMNLLT